MTQKSSLKTAGLIIIGNEILSGRTLDKNTQYIAQNLAQIGVQMQEVRIIPDVIDTIITTVQHFSRTYDYVFTTGGIGPTHDDKTAAAVAKAFAVDLIHHPQAHAALVDHYGGKEHMNEGRIKMTQIPQGASLITNPVSVAPGFKIGNVHVMAGVPKIMQGMLSHILPTLEGGDIIQSRQMVVNMAESEIAPILSQLEQEFETIDIGSYPKYKDGKPEVTIILRSTDEETLNTALTSLENRLG